ncbi:MAG: recombinase family protein [Rhodospirillales bacterium]|nr:recombinase family protein [Rhodospirillales bacterium]
MPSGTFVAYYRVSTARQGRSGLGLDAQRKAVADYLNGGAWRLAAEFTEVESGKVNARPQLAAALAACRLHRATLVIAKLDRLSRNAAFLLNLRDAGVDFVATDMPDANRLTVGILAMVAEQEREAISARTKAALAAAKARGTKLGTPGNLSAVAASRGRGLGTAASAQHAQKRVADLAPVIGEIMAEGKTSLNLIAAALNERKIPASRGGAWSAVQVSRVLARLPA